MPRRPKGEGGEDLTKITKKPPESASGEDTAPGARDTDPGQEEARTPTDPEQAGDDDTGSGGTTRDGRRGPVRARPDFTAGEGVPSALVEEREDVPTLISNRPQIETPDPKVAAAAHEEILPPDERAAEVRLPRALSRALGREPIEDPAEATGHGVETVRPSASAETTLDGDESDEDDAVMAGQLFGQNTHFSPDQQEEVMELLARLQQQSAQKFAQRTLDIKRISSDPDGPAPEIIIEALHAEVDSKEGRKGSRPKRRSSERSSENGIVVAAAPESRPPSIVRRPPSGEQAKPAMPPPAPAKAEPTLVIRERRKPPVPPAEAEEAYQTQALTPAKTKPKKKEGWLDKFLGLFKKR